MDVMWSYLIILGHLGIIHTHGETQKKELWVKVCSNTVFRLAYLSGWVQGLQNPSGVLKWAYAPVWCKRPGEIRPKTSLSGSLRCLKPGASSLLYALTHRVSLLSIVSLHCSTLKSANPENHGLFRTVWNGFFFFSVVRLRRKRTYIPWQHHPFLAWSSRK